MEYAIMTNNLCKNINGKSIISNINLRVKKGEIYGFLGPQNAGKTTISNLLSNLIKPSMGEVYILGENIFNLQYRKLKKVGIMIDKSIFYNNLTVMENLQIHCEYIGDKNIKIINNILEAVNLIDISKTIVKNLEVKEKRRLAIARSLVSMPELVILDEPLKGFSIIEIDNILELFKWINYEYGTTIFITAETLTSLHCLADTIGVIISGTIVEEVSMANIKNTNRISI
ncbi:ATP-binding cassette domain-containing protein [Clostridium cellulovorans]|uniref:ABC transporter related n=1 Tax=Clostridium cellulovorans (strain ATCC 35296 / DSM 3052 / OCM 3 / 743B) TaxID=573061 RepID=D9SS60_CLOC7|nr:ATP-binding cassette domain-containing protein [Clostridium cellulovorans]ADL52507.1 ABC transporter related [Clostridium cellulovorans 743B]